MKNNEFSSTETVEAYQRLAEQIEVYLRQKDLYYGDSPRPNGDAS